MPYNPYLHRNVGTLTDEQADENFERIAEVANSNEARIPLNNFSATTDPTVNDDVTQGYSTGSRWYNRDSGDMFILTNASSGEADWVLADNLSVADLGSAALADVQTSPSDISPGLVALAENVVSTFESTQDMASTSTGAAEGTQFQSRYYDSTQLPGSGAVFEATGVTDAGKAGNAPDADGYFYDSDGLQFSVIGRPDITKWGAITGLENAATTTFAIQACVNVGGLVKRMYVPATADVDFYINATITVTDSEVRSGNQRFFYCDGESKQESTILQTDNDQDIFYLERGDGNDSSWLWGHIRNVNLKYTNGLSSNTGVAIRHRRCFDFLFEDILSEGATYLSVSEGSAQCYYNRIFSRGTLRSEPGQTVYTFTVNGDINRSYGNYISNCEHQSGETYSHTFLLEGVDGLYVTNCHFNNSLEKVVINPLGGAVSDRVISVFFNNIYFDGAGAPVRFVHIKSSGAASNRIEEITFNNCLFRVASDELLLVSQSDLAGIDTIREIKITGCEAKQIQGNLFNFRGATIGDNASIVSNVSITGNIFHDGIPERTSDNPAGFLFEGSNIVFADNIVQGNWTDAGSVVVSWNYVTNGKSTGNLYDTERAEGTNESVTSNATNIIQDYVAGEFTATLQSGATTTPTTTLNYIKTGDVVHVFGDANFGTIDLNGSPLEIGGLPFSPAENVSIPAGRLLRVDFNSSSIQYWSISSGVTTLSLMEIGANSASESAVNTQSSGTFAPTFERFSFPYRASN